MKRFSAVFALTALAATTLGLAQQTAPPPASSPSASTSPSDPGARESSDSTKADKQALMKDCLSQVRTANPGVPEKDIKDFCNKEVNRPSPPHE